MIQVSFYQRGETIDYKNATTDTIPANTVIVLGSRIGVAGMELAPGEVGTVHVTGVFKFAKGAEAIAAGAEVYYSDTTGEVSAAKAEGAVLAGFTVEAAAKADDAALVKINA